MAVDATLQVRDPRNNGKHVLLGLTLVDTVNGEPVYGLSVGGSGLSGAITIANGADVTLGAKADAAAADDTSPASVMSLVKRVAQRLTDIRAALATTLPVGGSLVTITTELTRPADTTAYAANDVVSNSTSATTLLTMTNCARVAGGSGYITGVRVVTNLKSITPRMRVHMLNANNPTIAADNVAAKTLYADLSKRVGSVDLAAMTTSADTTTSDQSGASDFSIRIPFVCAAGDRNLYIWLETLDAFTPASGEKFSVVLSVDQN